MFGFVERPEVLTFKMVKAPTPHPCHRVLSLSGIQIVFDISPSCTTEDGPQQEVCGIARPGMCHRGNGKEYLLTRLFKDSAPDIYETPELTDDNSTAPVGGQGV
jgi:hypothetical protein